MLARSRPRRNRFVQIGLFIIIYTCYYALSASIIPTENPEGEIVASTEAAATYEGVRFDINYNINWREESAIFPILILIQSW